MSIISETLNINIFSETFFPMNIAYQKSTPFTLALFLIRLFRGWLSRLKSLLACTYLSALRSFKIQVFE